MTQGCHLDESFLFKSICGVKELFDSFFFFFFNSFAKFTYFLYFSCFFFFHFLFPVLPYNSFHIFFKIFCVDLFPFINTVTFLINISFHIFEKCSFVFFHIFQFFLCLLFLIIYSFFVHMFSYLFFLLKFHSSFFHPFLTNRALCILIPNPRPSGGT